MRLRKVRDVVLRHVHEEHEVVAPVEDPREIKRRKLMELARELTKLDLKRQVAGHMQAISTPTLLTGTITY